mmetsp:Transcript_808/g.1872  ORF Transcript_808/g.1872 Transcript_808/m.1872 type:complete len:274 (+) Transcript_808:30-851(+)
MLHRAITVRTWSPVRSALPRVAHLARGLTSPADAPAPAEKKPKPPVNRTSTTIEVIISKIFPAGFGWQAASVVAGDQGFEADSLNFALTTGLGDFTGVLVGHSALAVLKVAVGRSHHLGTDLVTGLWLATAAFCSGSAWQPTVNFLHDAANCSFMQTAVGCGAVTGAAFFAGLRIGRIIFKPLGLPGADYDNLCGDAMLSASIGAATGTFVGTDISFKDNVLMPFFGVTDSMSSLEGCIRAGASTSAGFLCMQTAQNLVLPRGANWIDPVKLK